MATDTRRLVGSGRVFPYLASITNPTPELGSSGTDFVLLPAGARKELPINLGQDSKFKMLYWKFLALNRAGQSGVGGNSRIPYVALITYRIFIPSNNNVEMRAITPILSTQGTQSGMGMLRTTRLLDRASQVVLEVNNTSSEELQLFGFLYGIKAQV
jgi:hypothetical protein